MGTLQIGTGQIDTTQVGTNHAAISQDVSRPEWKDQPGRVIQAGIIQVGISQVGISQVGINQYIGIVKSAYLRSASLKVGYEDPGKTSLRLAYDRSASLKSAYQSGRNMTGETSQVGIKSGRHLSG